MGRVLEFKDVYQSNVRPSEGAGTVTLISSDARRQVFNCSAAKTVALPSAGVLKGDVYVFENVATGNFALTVQSSGLNTLGLVNSLYSVLTATALIDSPTTAAHWKATLDYTRTNYIHGTTYNGSAPTMTLTAGGGSLLAVNGSSFRPFQMLDGTWAIDFSFQAQLSSASRTVAALTLSGITFAGNSGLAVGIGNGGALILTNAGICDTAAFVCYCPSQSTQEYYVSGVARLTGRPAWAF